MIQDQVTTTAASKSLEDARKKELRAGSGIIAGVGSFLEQVGGADVALGKLLVMGHKDAIDADAKRLRLDWAKVILKCVELHDAKNAETLDLSGMDAKDLSAVLTDVAIGLLENNEEYRSACLEVVLRRNPNFLQELNSDAGLGREQALLESSDA